MDCASVFRQMASESELNTSVEAALAAATTLALTSAQMVALLDRSIAVAIALGGAPTTQITIGGQQFAIGLEAAKNLRAYYAEQDKKENRQPWGFVQGYHA